MITTFKHHKNPKSDTLDVVLHGGSYNINTPFMQKVFDVCRGKGHSAIAFNFPYRERGEENSSGSGLKEELEMLQTFLDYCEYKKYKNIRFVGKSLGAIVASLYLDKLPKGQMSKFSIVVLGYVTGHVKLQNFTGPIAIIQGEKDKFGNINKVKGDLKNAKSKDIEYFEIKGADHSYKNPKTKKPDYVNEAMKVLSKII
jgi:predicted alpha/beta-hydrolase family hydrolase